jgi:hypothetical protein
MQFYDATNKQGICQEIDRLCDSNDTSYPRVDKTSRVNNDLEDLVGKIIISDGTWQYDDTNHTDHPRGKGTLVEGQEDYSFAAEYLQIEAVEVLDTNNYYNRLKPLDHQELNGLSPQEYFGVDSSGDPVTGMPEYFDQVGDTIRLYPAPTSGNVTLASGLRVWFKRTASLFTVASDTSADTTTPGLPSPYHVLLAYMASLPYCMGYKKDRVALYEKKIQEMTENLLKHYAYREQAKVKTLTGQSISYR